LPTGTATASALPGGGLTKRKPLPQPEPIQGELFEPDPISRRVNVDKIEAVLLGEDGGAVIVAPRGGRQYRINVPREAVGDLIERLRRML
jgi:hypothetical protein